MHTLRLIYNMKKYLVNYANKHYYNSQKKNSYTGINVGKLDYVFEYSVTDLDNDFAAENRHILNQERGAGFWLWKPYIIKKTLEKIEDGDILFYCDSGAEFISSVEPLVEICINESNGLLCFAIDPHLTGNPDVGQIKRDALILMNCDVEQYIQTNARLASFMLFQKSKTIVSFVNEWLYYCCDERVLTDIPNTLGENHKGFITHRHDQAVFSILSKKYGFDAYRDPCQWGNPFKGLIKGEYPQIINHTRNRN
jgi:hypothetical protein